MITRNPAPERSAGGRAVIYCLGVIPATDEATVLLEAWSRGDLEALERLMPLVVDELRRIAARHFESEDPGHTLQPTAVVNELYLRFAGRRTVQWKGRAHFFSVAAQMMRRLLVDHARSRRAGKRGGSAAKVTLDEESALSPERDLDLIALDEALSRLEGMDSRQSRIVELKCFAGLTIEEIAEALELGPTTVKQEWKTALLWLRHELSRT